MVSSQQLHTWAISGYGLQGLAKTLRKLPGIDLVASFGATLHVSGKDRARLEASLQAVLQGTTMKMAVVPASLEDAFIYLMQGSQDQFKG